MNVFRTKYPKRRFRSVFLKKATFRVHYKILAIRGKRDSGGPRSIRVSKMSQPNIVRYGKVSFRSLAREPLDTNFQNKQKKGDTHTWSQKMLEAALSELDLASEGDHANRRITAQTSTQEPSGWRGGLADTFQNRQRSKGPLSIFQIIGEEKNVAIEPII